MQKLTLTVLFGLLLSGCSTFGLGKLQVEGAASGALCIDGSGPPLTGEGHVAVAHTNEGFRGQVIVTPDCGIHILSE